MKVICGYVSWNGEIAYIIYCGNFFYSSYPVPVIRKKYNPLKIFMKGTYFKKFLIKKDRPKILYPREIELSSDILGLDKEDLLKIIKETKFNP